MPTNRHNQRYIVLLIVLAFFLAIGVVSILMLSQSPTLPVQSQWSFRMSAAVNGMFVAAIVVTLILRGTAPAAGRIATKALNIVMLLLVPFGTALGIYGLLKVDKDEPVPPVPPVPPLPPVPRGGAAR